MKDSSKLLEAINFINEDYIHSAQQFLGISSPQEEAEEKETYKYTTNKAQ